VATIGIGRAEDRLKNCHKRKRFRKLKSRSTPKSPLSAEVSMPLKVVLAIGFDQSLLRPRTLVLQSAGYLVESVSSLKEAVDRFESGDFDLVLLCHSVPRKDRYRLTSFLRSSGSRTPIVSIAGTLGECDAFASATLEDGPNRFLAGVRAVLVKAEETPAGWVAKSANRETWR
jgi:CheY-like chemotaxis protein